MKQSESQAPAVPEGATQGAEARGLNRSWVEASVCDERMLAALETAFKRQIANAFSRHI